ncbi:MAG: uroporphyrinogen-III C-methyltransferase, partial [Candidatus Kapaibacteriota bacterium]
MQERNEGFVYIIGAGPGDPQLITLKGVNAIKKADVILYDRLVNPTLLDYAKENAMKVFVGKEPGQPHLSQEEINNLMVTFALEGKIVARVKGGDPYVFGRGSEEALHLSNFGIPFEIIPGVTAGIGASAYSGIPLTHRSLVTQVVFLTAHEDPHKQESQIDYAHLAKLKNTTIVIYMGAGRLTFVVEELIKNGIERATPAAIVENATTPMQRTFCAALNELPEIARTNNLKPPLVTIISPCTVFSSKLNWFERKPLFGKIIVNTRAKDQSELLTQLLEAEGAKVLPFPVFETHAIELDTSILETLIQKKYNWLVFTSVNGVRYFIQNLIKNRKLEFLSGIKVATIGAKTAQELNKYGFSVDFCPEKFNSAEFLEEFTKKFNLQGCKILRIKGNFQTDPITENLRKYCSVDTLEVYRITKFVPSKEEIDKISSENID